MSVSETPREAAPACRGLPMIKALLERAILEIAAFVAAHSKDAAADCPSVEEMTTPPIVGQRYRVPCVFLGLWVPVLTPRHADPELPGAAGPHYHLDNRFMARDVLRALLSQRTRVEGTLWERGLLTVLAGGLGLRLRALPCLRKQTVHPGYGFRHVVDTLLPPGACLTEGRCPHRGVQRTAMAEVVRGGARVLVCPGHGARFDADTGLLRRCRPSRGAET